MPTPEGRRSLLPLGILSGVVLAIPWAQGGLSPGGQASLVLPLSLAAAVRLSVPGPSPFPTRSPVLPVAVILIAVSAVRTIHPDRTVQTLLLLLAYLLAGNLAADAARGERWAARLLLTAMLLSGLSVSSVALVRALLGSDPGLYSGVPTGPFGYPNALAGFLLLTLSASLAVGMDQTHRGVRAAAAASGVLMTVTLILTGARGAMLALAAGLAAWVALDRRSWWQRHRSRLVLAVLGGLGGILGAAAFLFVRLDGSADHADSLGKLGDTSLVWRQHILRWTWAMAWDQPWWGVGPGAFPVALTHYQRIPYVSGMNPHNLYLEVAAEYGLPAGLGTIAAIGGFLWRAVAAVARSAPDDPDHRRLGAIVMGIAAFAVHSAVDLDWSYPAIAVTAASMLGLASSILQRGPREYPRPQPAWRGAWLLILAATAILATTRYSASALVASGRGALAAADPSSARRTLAWALRLNPLSLPARQWMARTFVQAGDVPRAIEVAEQARAIAPLDPNTHFLAGEIHLAAGRWEIAQDRFQTAAERAPFAQLRFYAGLVESAARQGSAREAARRFEGAIAIFTPQRVLADEARCLAPGDRYLLARMGRLAARSSAGWWEPSRQLAVEEIARTLGRPDSRGICRTVGRSGQTSPEATVESFWHAMSERGWVGAARYLVPQLQRAIIRDGRGPPTIPLRPRRVALASILSLQGGEREVTLRFEIELEPPTGSAVQRCGEMRLRLLRDGWFAETIPTLDGGPCDP